MDFNIGDLVEYEDNRYTIIDISVTRLYPEALYLMDEYGDYGMWVYDLENVIPLKF